MLVNLIILKKKLKKTNLEKYGTEVPTKSKIVQDKTKETNLKKYGKESVFQVDEIKSKIKQTNLKKYGSENPFSSEILKDKIIKNAIDAKMDKYGTLVFNNKYFFNEIYFDSAWELYFYIYHINKGHNITHEPCNFSYKVNKKEHFYFPDFKVNNKYYEIKGDQFLTYYKNGKIKSMVNPYDSSQDKIYQAKYKCMKEHNVIIIDNTKIQKYIDYVQKLYGLDYIEQFKIQEGEKIE